MLWFGNPKLWKWMEEWMEDDFPFQLADFKLQNVTFEGRWIPSFII